MVMVRRTLVSIPYRYATNAQEVSSHSLVVSFQFLIGTLQTPQTRMATGFFGWFQFLIGTLQTRAPK